MVDRNTIEAQRTNPLELPVKATIGYLHMIRNDRGYYEAKVAAWNPPLSQKDKDKYYLLGTEKNEKGEVVEDGAWIRFGDRSENIVMLWQPNIGDKVIVFTLGSYDWESGWLFRISTSYDNDALQAQEFEINCPATIFSGKGGVL